MILSHSLPIITMGSNNNNTIHSAVITNMKSLHERWRHSWSKENPHSLCRSGSRLRCTTIGLCIALVCLILWTLSGDVGVMMVGVTSQSGNDTDSPFHWICNPALYDRELGMRVTCDIVGFLSYVVISLLLAACYFVAWCARGIGYECYYAHYPDQYVEEGEELGDLSV